MSIVVSLKSKNKTALKQIILLYSAPRGCEHCISRHRWESGT